MKTLIVTLIVSTFINTPAFPMQAQAVIDPATLTLFIIGLAALKGARFNIQRQKNK